ncbi:MAG: glycosyltransferase family 4 protein [Planctomycetota bacterium]
MRILLHDFGAYPFILQLAHELARRGHEVTFAYSEDKVGPNSRFDQGDRSAERLDIHGVRVPPSRNKQTLPWRFFFESAYAKQLAGLVRSLEPEVVISANCPSLVSGALAKLRRKGGFRFIDWRQDLYGLAAKLILAEKLGPLGSAVGNYLMRLDRDAFRAADHVVAISDDFIPMLIEAGVDRGDITVVHNWAPLEECDVQPRDNDWSRGRQLSEGPRFVYSGTLAMKHNPAILLGLAEWLDRQGNGQLVVVSEGSGSDWLRQQAEERGVRSLKLLGFQPYEELPLVLGSADVLVVILEPDASVFSVPSKVLSYMCAGRPILGAVNRENLAAKTVLGSDAGRVVSPEDEEGFVAAAGELLESEGLRERLGANGRRFAESHFDLGRIADQFEAIMGG